MTRRILFRLWGVIWLSVFAVAATGAQDIVRPATDAPTTFAIVADAETARHCTDAINAYKQVLEQEGLGVFVVSDRWESPEPIRAILKDLHENERLEGAVLIGDIPLAMITKAQHLTSAFKMDERLWDIKEASVPSDRFYEDFDLVFEPIPESRQGLMHFYALSPDSPQYIECDIYSGRIKPQKMLGDPYAQVSRYLEKAVREHRRANAFDRFVSYTGDGSYSNSLMAWRSEPEIVNEQFGDTFTRTDNIKFLRYSMDRFMKDAVIKELRRDDLDFMVFHEHGLAHRLYLSGDYPTEDDDEHVAKVKEYLRTSVVPDDEDPYRRIRWFVEKYGVDSTWYADWNDPALREQDSLNDLRTGIILQEVEGIRPNARFIIFDACYNGDYREDDFMAGMFTMCGGNTVACFANSVNVLQDKSAFDMLGLLGQGVRLGNWAKHINILESHIIGDPTYRFAAPAGQADLNLMAADDDAATWLNMLDDPHPDVQNLAMMKLFRGGHPDIAEILWQKFSHSPYAVVRWNAFVLLERLDHPYFREALKLASTDRFEFLRRIAANRMGRCGDEEFIPYLIDAYVDDNDAARVKFNVQQALLCFDRTKVEQAVEEKFRDADYYDAARYRQELLDIAGGDNAQKALRTIADRNAPDASRKAYIDYLRNLPYNQITPQLLEILADSGEKPYIRTLLAESLAWFTTSEHKPRIIEVCRDLAGDPGNTPELERELRRALNRLTSPK